MYVDVMAEKTPFTSIKVRQEGIGACGYSFLCAEVSKRLKSCKIICEDFKTVLEILMSSFLKPESKPPFRTAIAVREISTSLSIMSNDLNHARVNYFKLFE